MKKIQKRMASAEGFQYCFKKITQKNIINQKEKMKKAIASLCFVTVGFAGNMRIGIGSRLAANNMNVYDLNCDGGYGNVKYYVEGLPNGVQFNGAAITVTSNANAGNHTLRIKAVDEAGNVAERVINLTITTQYSNAGQLRGLADNADRANGGFNAGGLNGGYNPNDQAPNGQNPNGQAPNGQAPNGQAPNGQAPNGQAPNGQNPNGPNGPNAPNGQAPRLDGILSAYPGTQAPLPKYDGDRFPQARLPTGADPNIPNTSLITIPTDQARPTPANRNPITPDDVALKAASDRHQNAIKGITNLLKIIDQARANKDKAQNDIQAYTQAYNDAVAGQRNAQNDIISIETRTSQIVGAITSLTATVEDLRNRINESAARSDALNRQKTTIIDTITNQEGRKAQLLDQLKGIDNQVGQRVNQLSIKKSECQSLNDSLNRKTLQLNNAQNELANIQINRNNAVVDINNKAANVDDLRAKLQQAEKDLADAKIRLADLDARRLALPAQINAIKNQVDNLQARAKACADQVARLQNIINNLKGGDYNGLTKDIGDIDAKISTSRSKVSEIDAQIAASQGPIEDLKSKLNQATQDLTFIRSQKNDSDVALRTAYQRGNDANNRVAFAKQNLDAIVKRFQDESKIVSDGTLNLERARAEQALARQGLEELISHYTDALPYAIVPNGNLANNPGTPNGNNPSGSPLGPINQNGNGAPGAFKINNWVNYLSTAYGAGVNPSFPGSVNELFPFNFLSGVSGNMSQGTDVLNGYGDLTGLFGNNNGNNANNGNDGARRGGCFKNKQTAAQVVATGVVNEVRQDSFDVKADDGLIYTINVAPCTQLNANKANYKMAAGHKAIVKGWRAANAKANRVAVDGSQVTCLN